MQPNSLKTMFKKIKEKLKQPILFCIFIAFCLNLILETCSRDSFWGAIIYIFSNPLVFLYNTVIIAVSLSPSLFFKRRKFVTLIISLVWIAIGITDFILLMFRTTPFTATDIKLMKSAVDIWHYYLKFYHLILIGVGFLLVIVACIFAFKKMKKDDKRVSLMQRIIYTVSTIALSLVLTHGGLKINLLASNFGNLADAFHLYGLPYCFVNSIINTGIDKPDIYNADVVDQIVDGVENGNIVLAADIEPSVTPALSPTPSPLPSPTPTPTLSILANEKNPNIIMLQLESFFDPIAIKGISFTSDPLPNFHKLQQNYSSGYLSVPSIGAGTANTEFEVITGMNLDFFGPGEYPYKTILQKTTCESISFNLKPLGYTTHAIHDNTGTFYDRNQVFSQLGFDTFTSVEYMNNVERTPTGWAKDFVLTSQIKDTLEATAGKDFIYTISVQGHGSYPEEDLLENKVFDVTLPEGLEDLYTPLLYYSHQIYEMDQFIGQLTAYLDSLDEDTILVMYGDHLPGFQLTEDEITNGNLYQTPYVLWSNFDLENTKTDLEAYQLYSYVLGRVSIDNGLITKLHQTQQNSDIYLKELELLEYDMLYGELNCFNGVNPYSSTDLQMGIHEITILNISQISSSEEENTITVTGENFTPYSKIYVNGESISTTFQDPTTLITSDITLKSGDVITVIQSGDDLVPLSSTDPYTF